MGRFNGTAEGFVYTSATDLEANQLVTKGLLVGVNRQPCKAGEDVFVFFGGTLSKYVFPLAAAATAVVEQGTGMGVDASGKASAGGKIGALARNVEIGDTEAEIILFNPNAGVGA